jgi:glutathione synthase/RimK-type ligase-like ATP-grasp enzyme
LQREGVGVRGVLILAPEGDFHALGIQALLKERGCPTDIIDTATFPSGLKLVQTSDGRTDVTLNGRSLASYRSIWWRRPSSPKLPDELRRSGEEGRFAHRECREALWGALHASGVPIFNRPEMEAAAAFKPYQLRVAQDCELRVPPTLITNDPDAVLRFRQRHGDIVYKALSATALRMTETRVLRDEDVSDLSRLRYAPVIFQKYIERGDDYRVAVVGEQIFAARIVSENPEAAADWRLDMGYKVEPTQLDAETGAKLVRLLRALNLASGSADFRTSSTGELYFLEINPSGQFLFLDLFGGMNVAGAFCDMLVNV